MPKKAKTKKVGNKAALLGDGKNYPTTAVEWFFRDDPAKWVPFDQKSCNKFEWEYDNGNQFIPVDDHRFLDLSLSTQEILDNFTKGTIDDDEPLIGVQRRFDDETRRRAIKREVPSFFDKLIILNLTSDKKQKLNLQSTLELYGALVRAKLIPKCTLAVVNTGDETKFQKEISEAQDAGITVVTTNFVDDCIKNKKLMPTANYEIKKQIKRKAEEIPSIKKSKTETEPFQTNLIRIGTGFVSCPTVKNGTVWNGMCTSLADNSVFPVILTVSERNDENSANGTIQWPTLNSKTKFKASFKEDLFKVNEFEAISGEDEVDLPNDYEFNVKGDSMTGKLITDDPELASSLKLDKLPTPVSSSFDNIKSKTILKGTVSYDFQFEITSRIGGKIEGEITWPTLGNAKTKVKGNIEGEEFSFQEYETQFEEVVVPVDYLGQIENGVLKGNFSGEGNQGLFSVNLN